MVTICPTVTTDDLDVYRLQIEQTVSYATRIHIDVSDGVFTPNKLINIKDIWWPGGVRADLHVMYRQPFDFTDELIALRPQLIIVHAEAEGNFLSFAEAAHNHGIEVGVALLPDTKVNALEPAVRHIDHVLIFSGKLGYFGGHADLKLLEKVKQIKILKPSIEIGWDGGVNDQNVRVLADGGIEVLNAGGYLHGAKDSAAAYETLKMLVDPPR